MLEENPDWAYAQIQARAEEMLAAEPLPELERVGRLMASSAAVLDGLNSKQSQSLQLKFLNQADGAILSDVANDPKRAERMVDAMTSLFQRRLDQTQQLLPDPTMKRRASRASGPYNFLPGGYERVSVRERSKDDPFDNVPLEPLQLFGTRQGGMFGGALSKLILAYDERLAGLQETYRVSEFEREETRVRKNLQAFSETVDPKEVSRVSAPRGRPPNRRRSCL